MNLSMHNNFIDTTCGDGTNTSNTIKFTHNLAILNSSYWNRFGGAGTYDAASDSEQITISAFIKFKLVLYTDVRLIVQEEEPHFFLEYHD
jgi:hypothetical protein